MLQDAKAMKSEVVDDVTDIELGIWGLKNSARIDVPCTSLEHVRSVVIRELEELADRLKKICRDDQERMIIRLYRVKNSVQHCHQNIRPRTKSRNLD
ncbi:MAG: hypothetical protein AB7F22_28920 [Reyranella sp.]|uniref:hypothetical protein n=1 Tax=Reyranella sp. TaxID=1929291 RepID=UPI003D14B367